MANMFRLFVGVLGLLLAGIAPLHASLIFDFDESGHASYSTNGVNFTSLPAGTLMTDNTGANIPGHPDALFYNLSAALGANLLKSGDLPIGAIGGGLSDDLRFTNGSGALDGSYDAYYLVYYSFDGLGALADVGSILPSNLNPTPVTTERADGTFTYTADFLVTYNGISDAPETTVPEPASVSMFLLGLGAIGFGTLRRKSIMK
jgi:hypothetical protein